jgi:hypothetical protein
LWLQFYIVNLFILQDACVHLKLEEAASKLSESADIRSIDSFEGVKGVAAEAHGGQAFACGVARSISTTAAVAGCSICPKNYLPGSEWIRMDPNAAIRCPSS